MGHVATETGVISLEQVIDEIARVLWDSEQARLVVHRAGFPSSMTPRFNTAQVFWTQVIDGAANGMLLGGVMALVDEAAKQFPGNVIFKRYQAQATGASQAVAETGPTPTPMPTPTPAKPAVILLCTANAAYVGHRLRLEEELRAIDDALKRSRRRDLYEPHICPAVTFTQVLHELDDHEPTFVHFSGHGDPSGELILKGERSEELFVPPARIAELLEVLPKRPTLVTFATCHSRALAEAAARHADFAIGFEGALDDESAPLFSATLYERLASREPVDVERAFRLAVVACRAEGHETVELARLFAYPGRAVIGGA